MNKNKTSIIDIEEILIFLGLCCIGGGVGMQSVPLSLVTVGGLMFILGVLIVILRAKGR